MWSTTGRAVKMLDLNTNEVRHFVSQASFADFAGYSKTIVNQWIKDPMHLPITGNMLLKKANDNTPWRVPTLEEREYYFKDFILVRDPYEDKVYEYTSAITCAKALGIHRSVPHARALSKGQIVFVDGLQYKRRNEKTPWRIFSITELNCIEWRKNGEAYLGGQKLVAACNSTSTTEGVKHGNASAPHQTHARLPVPADERTGVSQGQTPRSHGVFELARWPSP